jgi:hypothetical protein
MNDGWGAPMPVQQRRRSAWPAVFAMAIPFAFIGLTVWWLESRFGAGVALMILGGLAGAACIVLGVVLSGAITKSTLQNAAQFNSDLASVERARTATQRAELGVVREHARGEREAFNHRAKLEQLEARRIDQLAQQRAKLLVDAERQAQQQQQARTWQTYEDEPSTAEGEFRFYE